MNIKLASLAHVLINMIFSLPTWNCGLRQQDTHCALKLITSFDFH